MIGTSRIYTHAALADRTGVGDQGDRFKLSDAEVREPKSSLRLARPIEDLLVQIFQMHRRRVTRDKAAAMRPAAIAAISDLACQIAR